MNAIVFVHTECFPWNRFTWNRGLLRGSSTGRLKAVGGQLRGPSVLDQGTHRAGAEITERSVKSVPSVPHAQQPPIRSQQLEPAQSARTLVRKPGFGVESHKDPAPT